MEPEVPYQEINPGEISWIVEPVTWHMLTYFRQTITWTGKTFRLETWDRLDEECMPVWAEEVPNNIQLGDIQTKLKQAAKEKSLECLKNYLIPMWESILEDTLSRFSPEDKEKVADTIRNISDCLELMEEFICDDEAIDGTLQELQHDLEDELDRLVGISKIPLP